MKNHSFVIALTAFNRPALLEKMLSSIAVAIDNENWHLRIAIDPSDQTSANLDVISLFTGKLDIQYHVNTNNKGVRQNPYDNIQAAFDGGADLVLVLEDDLQISRDALQFAQLVGPTLLDDPQALCANLLTTTCMSESIFAPANSIERDLLAQIAIETKFFSSYGLLIAKHQWQRHFITNWFSDDPRMENWQGKTAVGWDVAINRLVLTTPTLHVLQSLVPRVSHYGEFGTHFIPEQQQRSFDNISIVTPPDTYLKQVNIVDPVNDFSAIPSVSARMYLNLCRHLWDQQLSNLKFKHSTEAFAGKKLYRLQLLSREFLIAKRRIKRTDK